MSGRRNAEQGVPLTDLSKHREELAGNPTIRDVALGRAIHFVDREDDSKGCPVRIHYAVLGADAHGNAGAEDPRPKIVLIMGLAAGCACWRPQIEDLMMPRADTMIEGHPRRSPVVICVLDNRGCGHSSSPRSKADYSTEIMARDVFAVTERVQWAHYHVVGFSMGGMIATRMAALRPHCLLSLSLISASLGGWACMPKSFKAVRYLAKLLRANTPEKRAHMDIRCHFSKTARSKWVNHMNKSQHDVLVEEYLTTSDTGPPTPQHGTSGQGHACWTHSVSQEDADRIVAAPFPVLCAHGRHDIVATSKAGEDLAAKLQATMVVMEGAHMSVRECGHEVSFLLEALILGQPRMAERSAMDRNRHLLADRHGGLLRRSVSAPAYSVYMNAD